ncbi:MAG: UPF0280 family protein [Halobacteriota archaeon]|nr:UPF0280 family protein [Halobacteriota archaeon]
MKCRFQIKETVVSIIAEEEFVLPAKEAIMYHRRELENFITEDPFFKITLEPYPERKKAPKVINRMIDASSKVGIGPMSAVAGTISQLAVEAMIDAGATYAIVDNGGDIALINDEEVLVGIYAGEINDFALKVKPRDSILGICTSSGKIGPSISFGNSDAVTVVSDNTSVADSTATAIGNLVTDGDSIDDAIKHFSGIDGIDGILIICDGRIGTWGDLPSITRARVSYDQITRP